MRVLATRCYACLVAPLSLIDTEKPYSQKIIMTTISKPGGAVNLNKLEPNR